MGVRELRGNQTGKCRRHEAEADEADEQRAAHRVGVDRHRRAEHPLADRQSREGADDPLDGNVSTRGVGQPNVDAVP